MRSRKAELRRSAGRGGFTLVELLIALTLTGIIMTAAVGLSRSALKAEKSYDEENGLYQEGLLAMDRIVYGLKTCAFCFIPNANYPPRLTVAFSGPTNADGDFYFNDPAFPRIAEDPPGDLTADGQPGIAGRDDNGNGLIDERNGLSAADAARDDDEDGNPDGDWFDGIDNDGDGNIDNDPGADLNGDGRPGLAGIDDNGDGIVDNGSPEDDDEDGLVNEDPAVPMIFTYNAARHALEQRTSSNAYVGDLCTHVTAFTATYNWDSTWRVAPYITLSLTVTGDNGTVYTYAETVYPRNLEQLTGKRCR